MNRELDGASAILAYVGEQREQWIKDKVGEGTYLEEVVRYFFAVVQASQTSQQEDCPYPGRIVRWAASSLQVLARTEIRYPAEIHAKYLPVPDTNDAHEVDAFKRDQYGYWVQLNVKLEIYRKGSAGVILPLKLLQSIWEETWELTKNSRSPESTEMRSPSIAERLATLSVSSDSEETPSWFRKEFQESVDAWKQDTFQKATAELNVYVRQSWEKVLQCGGDKAATEWYKEWMNSTSSKPASSLSLCPGSESFVDRTATKDGGSQRQ